jgi:hypothetical protein
MFEVAVVVLLLAGANGITDGADTIRDASAAPPSAAARGGGT